MARGRCGRSGRFISGSDTLADITRRALTGGGGSFWTWCEDSKHPLAWPATDEKLSMTESETIEASSAFGRRKSVTRLGLAIHATRSLTWSSIHQSASV